MPAIWQRRQTQWATTTKRCSSRNREPQLCQGGGTDRLRQRRKPSAAQKHVSLPAGGSRQRNCSQDTLLVIDPKSVQLHFEAKMIPQAEDIEIAPDYLQNWSNTKGYCEESRCNQLQTAAEVYRRMVERLQRQSVQQNTASSPEETLKQIWIASFTGGNLYYRA